MEIMMVRALSRGSWPAITFYLMDFLLGVLAGLGQAPWGLWPATLMGLSWLFYRLRAAPPSAAFLRSLTLGAGYFALALNWIVEPFLVQPEIHGWMAPFALAFMALGGGLFWAVPAWLAARLSRVGGERVLALAAALLLSDWLRGWIFTGFPWALLGHVWVGTPVAQAASVIGAVGLSGLTLAAVALPFLGQRRRGAGLAVLLLVGVWSAGLWRLDRPLPAPHEATLRLVQPNAAQARKWDPDWAQVFWQRLLDESSAPPALGAAHPDLVIWPETAVNFLLNYADQALPLIADEAGAPVIFGIQRAEGARYYNSLVHLTRAGEVSQIYDKFHLVPFGEYIPWGDQLASLGIGAFAAQQGYGYTPGPGAQVMRLPGLPEMQPLICYEAIFPQHVRAAPGAEWLLQITNDAWFGTRSGPYQHLAQARLRAIESGRPLVRVANTGITAVIDARGQVIRQLALDTQGHLDAQLPGALGRTLWMRLGPLPVVLGALLMLAGVVWRKRRGGA